MSQCLLTGDVCNFCVPGATKQNWKNNDCSELNIIAVRRCNAMHLSDLSNVKNAIYLITLIKTECKDICIDPYVFYFK